MAPVGRLCERKLEVQSTTSLGSTQWFARPTIDPSLHVPYSNIFVLLLGNPALLSSFELYLCVVPCSRFTKKFDSHPLVYNRGLGSWMFIRTFRLFLITFSSVLAILKVRRSAGPLYGSTSRSLLRRWLSLPCNRPSPPLFVL